MTKSEAIAHYGNQKALCDAMGIYQATVSMWKDDTIPRLRQYQLEVISEGKLKADRSPIPRQKRPKVAKLVQAMEPAKLDIRKIAQVKDVQMGTANGMTLTELMRKLEP